MQCQFHPSDPEAARELGRACRLSPATAQVLLNRGIADAESARDYLLPLLSGLTSPEAMADREAAADRLARAIRQGERIAVFGDYDVDGTASAAILAGIIEQLGGTAIVLIANRFDGGYGLNDTALGRVLEVRPNLLVACDCGSSDHANLEKALRSGLDVIVVDHHMVGAEPLPASAFLNPQRPDCGFPYKGLASVGLVLSLGAAVRAALRMKLDLRSWLDLVALGTIADVAPLDGDNRRLVRSGLNLLASNEARPGILGLSEAVRMRRGVPVGAADVAFRFAPRLNAAGRLGDQTLTLSLLRARTLSEARGLAARMERLNHERKRIERQVTDEAIAQVIEVYGAEPETGVVAGKRGWHRGVVGISASRLVERFNVPSVVIAIEDGIGRGSCRATKGFRLHDALSRCKDVLDSFGGHQEASGVTVREERIEELRCAFAEASRGGHFGGQEERDVHMVDVQIEPGGFCLPPASELCLLEPVGEANAAPVFRIPEARVQDCAVVGGEHLRLTLRVGRQRLSALGFRLAHRNIRPGGTIDAVGVLRPDTWRGGEQVQLWLAGFENLSSAG